MKPKRDWMLNWNLLTIIVGITLILEVLVVLVLYPPERKGYTILGISIAVAVIGFLGYSAHASQRQLLLELQGTEPIRGRAAVWLDRLNPAATDRIEPPVREQNRR